MAQTAWHSFSGFELITGRGHPLRLDAREVGQKLEIVIDDHPAAEPQRWRLTEKGAAMFSSNNIELLVSLGYAERVDG